MPEDSKVAEGPAGRIERLASFIRDPSTQEAVRALIDLISRLEVETGEWRLDALEGRIARLETRWCIDQAGTPVPEPIVPRHPVSCGDTGCTYPHGTCNGRPGCRVMAKSDWLEVAAGLLAPVKGGIAAERAQTTFGIGWAVESVRLGRRVRRAGWNGKGMWLEYAPAVTRYDTAGKEATHCDAYVVMQTARGTYIPWLCSMTDLLATDWEVAE